MDGGAEWKQLKKESRKGGGCSVTHWARGGEDEERLVTIRQKEKITEARRRAGKQSEEVLKMTPHSAWRRDARTHTHTHAHTRATRTHSALLFAALHLYCFCCLSDLKWSLVSLQRIQQQQHPPVPPPNKKKGKKVFLSVSFGRNAGRCLNRQNITSCSGCRIWAGGQLKNIQLLLQVVVKETKRKLWLKPQSKRTSVLPSNLLRSSPLLWVKYSFVCFLV